jgi:hypothetical protein
MARIRSIKPEFPHSESMGRVSRDARLTFIQLWTLSDDAGRLRGNSRMLASLLFPYDDDAKDLIDGWLGELEREGCVIRYLIEGTSYVQVCNWLTHQKIDKPTPSKLPAPPEKSRVVESPREVSSEDLDLEGIKEGKGEENARAPGASRGTGVIPAGNRPTPLSADAVFESLLEDWKRDIPECNQEAFTRWSVHIETSGRRLGAQQRLYQARQLAGNGDHAAQAEVVDFCIGKPYFSLIPLGDVRARTQGMTRGAQKGKPAAQSEVEALQKLKDRRAAIGLPNFRDPRPGEASDAYGKAQDEEFKRLEREKGNAPRFAARVPA